MSNKYWRLEETAYDDRTTWVFRIKPTPDKLMDRVNLSFNGVTELYNTGRFMKPYCAYCYTLNEEEYDD